MLQTFKLHKYGFCEFSHKEDVSSRRKKCALGNKEFCFWQSWKAKNVVSNLSLTLGTAELKLLLN